MENARQTILEIVVSVGVVGLFVALIVWIGATYNVDGLSAQGGLLLVGSIALFVLIMSGVGIGLAYAIHRT